jgi:hypothetical protein
MDQALDVEHYALVRSRRSRLSAPLLSSAILGAVSGCSGGDQGGTATTIAEGPVLTLDGPATTAEPPVSAVATTTPTESEASVSASRTSVTVDAAPELAVSRPYVDPAVCAPVAAKNWEAHDLMLRPFAVHSESPIAMQVIANGVTGPAGPLALLLRYRDRPRPTSDREPLEINDW